MKKFVGFILQFAIALLILLNFATASVDGMSMYPTYNNEDFLFLKRTKDVSSGDVIAIYSSYFDALLCKRVIAKEGDTLTVRGTTLYVNDKKISESYINEKRWKFDYSSMPKDGLDIISETNGEFKARVTFGNVLVMGDNRNRSTDSRELGVLKMSDIKGKVLVDLTKKTHLGVNGFKLVVIVLIIFSMFLSFKDFKRKED